MKLDFSTKYFLQIITIIFIAYSLIGVAYGQNVTPPKPVQPTVAIPAQTQPNPNLQYLPQKAYVQAFGPEYGLPASPTPLQSISPIPVQQVAVPQTAGIGGLDMSSIMPYLVAGGSAVLGYLGLNKAKKAQTTSQENAAMNVKQAVVQEEALKLQYETMGTEKANAINDKPEIRLTELAKMKDKTVDTATKS